MSSQKCEHHPDRPAEMTCASCGRPWCGDCVDPSTPGTCVKCAMIAAAGEAAEERVVVKRVGLEGKPRRRLAWLAPTLVALNVVALIAWSSFGPAPAPPDVQTVFDQLRAFERIVEGRKDEAGRYPASIDALRSALPPELAEQVRNRRLYYIPTQDRRDYVIEAAPLGLRLAPGEKYQPDSPDEEDDADAP